MPFTVELPAGNSVLLRIDFIAELSTPKHVIDQEKSTGLKQGKCSFLVISVISLVRIYEDKVERFPVVLTRKFMNHIHCGSEF